MMMSHFNDCGPVRVPAEVLSELEILRASGLTNMLDIPRVQYLAVAMMLAELAAWLPDHHADYGRGIFQDFAAEENGPFNPRNRGVKV